MQKCQTTMVVKTRGFTRAACSLRFSKLSASEDWDNRSYKVERQFGGFFLIRLTVSPQVPAITVLSI